MFATAEGSHICSVRPVKLFARHVPAAALRRARWEDNCPEGRRRSNERETDATARLSITSSKRLGPAPAMGYLGGPTYPHDPTDLGPLGRTPRRCSSSSP